MTKEEIIERASSGIRNMTSKCGAFLWYDNILEDFIWDTPTLFGVPVYHISFGFPEMQYSMSIPLPLSVISTREQDCRANKEFSEGWENY